MKKLAVLASVLFASSAFAQQAPPAPDPTQELQQDFQAYSTAQKHLLEDIQKLIQANQALKAENEKLKSPQTPTPAPAPSPKP